MFMKFLLAVVVVTPAFLVSMDLPISKDPEYSAFVLPMIGNLRELYAAREKNESDFDEGVRKVEVTWKQDWANVQKEFNEGRQEFNPAVQPTDEADLKFNKVVNEALVEMLGNNKQYFESQMALIEKLKKCEAIHDDF